MAQMELQALARVSRSSVARPAVTRAVPLPRSPAAMRARAHGRLRALSADAGQMCKPGDMLPAATLIEDQKPVPIHDIFKGKTGVLLGMPGAFTPGCTQTHLPGYLDRLDEVKAAGAEEVAVVCVNDPYVMSAWAKDMKTEGKVHMLADPRCEFSRDLGCVQDDTATLGGMRSRRYSMIVHDNVVRFVNVEKPGPKELSVSLVDNALQQLKQLKESKA